MVMQQYVEINEEQPCGSKASQGDLKDSNLDDSCNGASIKGLPLIHFQFHHPVTSSGSNGSDGF